LGQVLGRDYLLDTQSKKKGGLGLFRHHDYRLESAVEARDGHRYFSATAKFWLEHMNEDLYRRESFVLADELCYNATVLRRKTDPTDRWFPKTYVYDRGGASTLRAFAEELRSMGQLSKIARGFGFTNVGDFVEEYRSMEKAMKSGAFHGDRYPEVGYNAPLLCQFVSSWELGSEV